MLPAQINLYTLVERSVGDVARRRPSLLTRLYFGGRGVRVTNMELNEQKMYCMDKIGALSLLVCLRVRGRDMGVSGQEVVQPRCWEVHKVLRVAFQL